MENIRHTALAAAMATSFLMGGAIAKELPTVHFIATGGTIAMCIDPAVSAQVRPLMQMPQREFSCSAPDADADGCKSQSSPR